MRAILVVERILYNAERVTWSPHEVFGDELLTNSIIMGRRFNNKIIRKTSREHRHTQSVKRDDQNHELVER